MIRWLLLALGGALLGGIVHLATIIILPLQGFFVGSGCFDNTARIQKGSLLGGSKYYLQCPPRKNPISKWDFYVPRGEMRIFTW